jgi:hypothetical protein
MKFYPSDWRADPMLRLCTLAARGLWTEMLCLMHDAEPYGSLLVNGRRIDRRQLASLVGVPEKDCAGLLMELEGAGVFSRDPDTTIYSRRMRRDHEKAEAGRVTATIGWRQRKAKGTSPDKADGPPIGGAIPKSDGEPNTQKPEARYQSPDKEGTREVALAPADWPVDAFDQFWKAYPNKVDRNGATKSLAKAAKDCVAFADIMNGLDAYVAKTDDRPWCNPTTWINQARWEHRPAEEPSHAKARTGGSIVTAGRQLSDNFEREAEAIRAQIADLEAGGDDVLRLSTE